MFESELLQLIKSPNAQEELGRIGDLYSIKSVLGEGGMAVVFEAYDLRLSRKVAIKVLPLEFSNHPILRARFTREAQLMASLDSDYVITIFHIVDNVKLLPVPFFVMPLLRGQSLENKLISSYQLSEPEITCLYTGITAGLIDAHAANIIHRDIKPSNIWLETSRQTEADHTIAGPFRVKLLDFGIARRGSAMSLTGESQFLGSTAYSSPEQLNCLPLNDKSDIFSVGIVLYEAITGQHPFFTDPAMSAHEVRTAIREKNVPPLRTVAPNFGNKLLADTIDRMLQKNPNDRPASAQELMRPLVRSTGALGLFIATISSNLDHLKPLPTIDIDQQNATESIDTKEQGRFATTILESAFKPHAGKSLWIFSLVLSLINCLLLAVLIAESLGAIPKITMSK